MMTEIICYLDRDRDGERESVCNLCILSCDDDGFWYIRFSFFLFILHSLNKWIHCHMMSNIKCEYERVRFGQSVSNI